MSQHDSTLTTQPPASTDEQVALRARELYAQYAESTRTGEPAAPGARRRSPRKRSRPEGHATRPADAATPTHDDIALRAYVLFEQAGSPAGRDVEFWLEAERQLTGTPDA
jgi:hypothetical protein